MRLKMRNRTFTDTYRSTHQAVAQMVLDSQMRSCIGYPNPVSRGKSIATLEAATRGEGDISSWSFLSVTFRRAGTDCDLTVVAEPKRYGGNHVEPTTDAEGNEWEEYEVTCKVNHPCHGSTDAATQLARAQLYADVAMLGIQIQAELAGRDVFKMTRSAEDIAKQKREEDEQRVQAKVRGIVDALRKGMRVGSNRAVSRNQTEGIPVGDHQVTLNNDMQFVLEVNYAGDFGGILRRTA